MRRLPSGAAASAPALLALIDQAAFTGANFAGALLLAAFAGVESLGRYALIASVSALLHSLFVGAIVEPLTTFTASDRPRAARFAYGRVGIAAACATLVCGALSGVAGAYFGAGRLVDVAAGFVLFSGQAVAVIHKRHLYVVRRVDQAAAVSVSYALTLAAVVGAALAAGLYSEFVLALGSAFAGVVASGRWASRLARMRMSLAQSLARTAPSWRYSAWTLLTSIPSVVALQGLYWIADLQASRFVVGQLKLCEQLFAPAMQIINALGLLDQVKAVAEFMSSRTRTLAALVNAWTLRYTGIALLYSAGLVGFFMLRPDLSRGADGAFATTLGIYSLTVLAAAAAVPRNVAHKATREPKPIAVAYCTMAVTVVGGALASRAHTVGSLAAVLGAGWIVHALALQASWRRLLRRWAGEGQHARGPASDG